MATAKKNPAKVETRTVEITPATITLELSIDEAEAVKDVLGKVGGNPESTRRKYTQAAFNALVEALGYSRFDGNRVYTADMTPSPGNIGLYFTEDNQPER